MGAIEHELGGGLRSSDEPPFDVGEASTWLASEPVVGGPELPRPHLGGVVDDLEQVRVFHALFQRSAEPRMIGRYVALGTLGRGGMGTVLRAYDRELDREVAIKVLHRELDAEHTQRLRREAQAMAQVSHPNVAHVYEVGELEGQTFVAMELVTGQTLREWMRQQPPPDWRACVRMFVSLGAGLAAAHERGLVHRDFKPSNAIIDERGWPRVLDFGLARRTHEGEPPIADQWTPPSEESPVAPLEAPLTRPGVVLGTPAYMPPEQLDGREASASSDQFSFCVSLYEAVYGERPFEGTSLKELRASLPSRRIRPAPGSSKVPPALRKILLRGLELDPAMRWPSMDALLLELGKLVAPRRGRWLAWAVGAGLLALGAGLGADRYAAWASRCTGARAQLEGIWDETVERELQAAILGTELAYAPGTWDRVRPRLDAYASAWIGKHTEICEATRVTQQQTEAHMGLRMGCLQRRKAALEAVVKVLARADDESVEHAVALVDDLPRLSRCDDVEALGLELPPPEDSAVAERVDVLRRRLEDVRALDGVGAYDQALVEAQAVMDHAETVDYAPLRAEARLDRGLAQVRMNLLEEAERDLEQAYQEAATLGHRSVEAMAVRVLTFVVGVGQKRHEAGIQWGKVALSLSRGPWAEPGDEANALHQIGRVLFSQGKLEDALSHHRRVLAIRERLLGPRHLDVAEVLDAIGTVLNRQGHREEGLGYLQRALAIKEELLDPRHPVVGISYGNIAGALKDQGRIDEALEHYRRALAIFEALGSRDVRVGQVLSDIGVVLKIQGKLDEALGYYQRALAIQEERLGPSHPFVGMTLSNIGGVLARMGRIEETSSYFERSLAIHEQAMGPDHPSLAHPLMGLANATMALGDVSASRRYAERAVSIRAASGVSPDLLAEARFSLALALWEDPTQRARALALAEQARDGYIEAGPGEEEWLAEVEQWLRRVGSGAEDAEQE